ncbi:MULTISPECIES: sigma factor [unclassified Synechococcus]|uniref:sigma factor n=1 Tax=unclassified Synechococcus TaxID=2626047 RepID=UPI0020015568|nr:sigma factor [Synechococcus sp. A10-1-5-1]UPM50914.1 hypothetical protein MY494_03775 [Synechococcus sp. A10-1-5-1]
MHPSVRHWLWVSRLHPPLPERSVLELARMIQRWQQHPGGPDQAPPAIRKRGRRARDQLVRHNLALVGFSWRKQHSQLSADDASTADALQEGALNLLRAAEKFDPARGYRFSTYASFWIRRGLLRFCQRSRRSIAFPRDQAALVLKAQQLSEDSLRRRGIQPSLSWLAAQLSTAQKHIQSSQLEALIRSWNDTQTCTIRTIAS